MACRNAYTTKNIIDENDVTKTSISEPMVMSLLPFYKKLSKSSIRQLLACCCANRPWSPQTFGNTLFCRTGTWKGQRPFYFLSA